MKERRVIEILARAIPSGQKARLRRWHQSRAFTQAIQCYLRNPLAATAKNEQTFERLVYGWGNALWSADAVYLRECVKLAFRSNAAVLECGSGLSTILVAIACKARGVKLWSLEHDAEWAHRTALRLEELDIDNAEIIVSPLASYGTFEWYAPPLQKLPPLFDLVICDGPPSKTKGGRYGLLPVMRERLPVGCTILLDDAARASEVETVSRWVQEVPCQVVSGSSEHGYFKIALI